MGKSMLFRCAPLALLLGLFACSSSGSDASRDRNEPKIDPERVRRNSKNLQEFTGALLLCGSTQPGDWAEARKQFDILHPFVVDKGDPELIRQFKAGSESARKELARRGVILQSVLVFCTTIDRAKWEDARKTLMTSGEEGQSLLCSTLLGMLLNGENLTLFPQIRFTLVDSGPMALETTVGVAKQLADATPAQTAIFKMEDLVQVLMVIIAFGDQGTPALEELARNAKPNVRRCVARAVGESRDGSAITLLLRLLADSEWTVRMSATQAMGQMASVRSVAGPALVDRLSREQDGLVFRSTLRAIGDLLYADAIPQLMKILELPSRETLEVAMGSLYIITGEKHLRREQWYEWYRTRYPDWKKKNAAKP